MKALFLGSVLTGLLVSLRPSPSGALQTDSVLLAGTIKAAESLVFPHKDVKVTYDQDSLVVQVTFETPPTYKVNYADFYQRWRDNQWLVLQEFRQASISVNSVVVITNHLDGSGFLRIRHLTRHVDRYAKLVSDELWLRTATIHQRAKGSTKWEPVSY